MDPEIQIESKMCDALKVHGAQTKHLHNLLKFDSIFDIVRMRKYPQTFQLYCLSESYINWNQVKVLHSIDSPLNISSTFQTGYFVWNDNTRNKFKNKCWVIISRTTWRKRWRHSRPCQNRYMWYMFRVSMHYNYFGQVFTLETKTPNARCVHMVE